MARMIEYHVPRTYIFVEHEQTLYQRLVDGGYRVVLKEVKNDEQACKHVPPYAFVGKLMLFGDTPHSTLWLQCHPTEMIPVCNFLKWYEAQTNTKGASLTPVKKGPPQPSYYPAGKWVYVTQGSLIFQQTASGFVLRYTTWLLQELLESLGHQALIVAVGGEVDDVLRGNPGHAVELIVSFRIWHDTLRAQAKSNVDTAAGHLVFVPAPRPAPEGSCAFCAAPANHWGTPWPLCAEAHCSAANHFHEERCQNGGVDTPETRAETLAYAKRWLEDQLAETAKQKPEGSCSFCKEPALLPNVPGTPLTCATHERAGWRLHHRLELGGVSDTPELRQEVLRHVAASDQFLRDGQREASGALTLFDEFGTERDRRGKGIAELKPPPEEIPLVGITPHYEWP
jgi:hypothetical protein